MPPATGAPVAAAFDAVDLAHARLLRSAGLGDTLAWDLVRSLVTDIGPRPAGSAADALAVRWAVQHLEALGFADVRTEPVMLTVWRRGATEALLLSPEPVPLVVTAIGNSVATEPAGLEADLAYYPDFTSLRQDTTDRARGRIVFIDQRMEASREGSGYGPAVLARVSGAVEAGRRGAVAVAIRSIGTDRERIAHTGALRYDPAVRAVPAIAVSIPDAEAIAARAATGTPLRMRLRLQAQDGVAATSHNVIADVPGGDCRDEVVLLGAHLDTWDISPGAQDDGAGVGIVIAAARALLDAGRTPRRTVRVVLFANEENGVDGARAYAQRHGEVPHQLVGESDMGAALPWRLRTRVHDRALPLWTAIAAELAPLGIEHEGNAGSPAPDAATLMHLRRWPAVEVTQDASRYFDVHHTVADTLDRIDPATLPRNVAAWAVVAWLSAQSPLPFGWGAGDRP